MLALMDAPLELEGALRRWLWSRPELVRADSSRYALRIDSRERTAIPSRVGRISEMDAGDAFCGPVIARSNGLAKVW